MFGLSEEDLDMVTAKIEYIQAIHPDRTARELLIMAVNRLFIAIIDENYSVEEPTQADIQRVALRFAEIAEQQGPFPGKVLKL